MILHGEGRERIDQGQWPQGGGNEPILGVAVHKYAQHVAHAGAHGHVLFRQEQVAVVGSEVEAEIDFAGYFQVVVIAELHGWGERSWETITVAKVGANTTRCVIGRTWLAHCTRA